jgi:hypothetical protein
MPPSPAPPSPAPHAAVHAADRDLYTTLRSFLAAVGYKPGWTLTAALGPDPFSPVRLMVQAELPDTYQPGRTIRIGSNHPVPPYFTRMPPIERARWLRSVLHAMEVHEADEWLTVDSERLFDPHNHDQPRR